MLFWIFLILLIVGVVMLFAIGDDYIPMSASIFAVGFFGVVASVVILCVNYIGIDGDV